MSTVIGQASRPRSFHPSMASDAPAPTRPPGWDLGPERRIDDGQTLAAVMGWFSLALGAAEVLAPRAIACHLGMEHRAGLVRAYGVREIATGVGILRNQRPFNWILARIAGDLLDLATLAPALAQENEKRPNVIVAVGAVAGATAADLLCAYQLRQSRRHPHRPAGGLRSPIRDEVMR